LWEHHDGVLRVVDAKGVIIADKLDPTTYLDFIGEASCGSSYLKSPYYRPFVDETQTITPDSAGLYRVGPLARLNICERIGTPLADKELAEFRDRAGRVALSSFYFHYARLIEILAATEAAELLLNDPAITSTRVRAEAGINRERGVGVSEAPRGTLFHDYTVDENGLIKKVNMIIATGHNNFAMNGTVKQIVKEFVKGSDIREGMLNRVEAGIRAYDPCLSCSTHAIGQMPLNIKVFSRQGDLVKEIVRD
jgi:NAD-reducing hydrogenase large subunit